MVAYCIKYIKPISNFLRNNKNKTKINLSFRNCQHLLVGVTQELVFPPLLYNIYIYQITQIVWFYMLVKQCIYCEEKIWVWITKLCQCFCNNYLNVNSGKFIVMSMTDNSLQVNAKGSLLSNKKQQSYKE